MLSTAEKKFSILFMLIVIVELVTGNLSSLTYAHYLAKPAIVFSLMILVYNNSDVLPKDIRNTTLLALLFSVIGDILLMFVTQNALFFTLGLLAFLLAHIMYIITFLKHRSKPTKAIGFGLILVIYAVSLFTLLKERLDEMIIPVLLYIIVILTMTITAFLRKKQVSNRSYLLVLAGAISFVISDSLLAINKFYVSIPFSGIFIMISYALAQYLIVMGILKINVTNT
ncbi:lysoplasmalogenase [Winogradskyella alexanderae]|uniref:Lysoplasmalogenase n=1 Tax=Winogradskyella alexanderae TaxID=2877123 RepID=A0ABS7XSD7_9FLAO|nr:lysoplasmalogenase [Winogradskyella alexanderae]MCA0132323.1 lysoplasmalogenase [Winogradskyella alexanderae]